MLVAKFLQIIVNVNIMLFGFEFTHGDGLKKSSSPIRLIFLNHFPISRSNHFQLTLGISLGIYEEEYF